MKGKKHFGTVDHVIKVSEHTRQTLYDDYHLELSKANVIQNRLTDSNTVSDKIFLIPNGLEDIYSKADIDREKLRKKWHISDQEFLILFVGRLQPVKGLIFLIEAFRNVVETIPNCRLMIVGNGSYDTYLQETKEICTKITFTGLLEKKELYELYRIADVGVIPSLFETFGFVAVEMMMHNLPIVATATSGLNEVVSDTCGLKVPIKEHHDNVEIDASLLAKKILYLLQHPVEAKKMGQNGRKRYLKEYSSEVFRKNMLQLYESFYY